MLLNSVLFLGMVLAAVRIVQQLLFIIKRKPFLWLTDGGQYWAVVTGAGSGMGFEFARQLALKGYNLALISLFDGELKEAKRKIIEELERTKRPNCKLQIRTLAVDFSRLEAYDPVEQFLAPFKKDIFVLVNNVGALNSVPDYFLSENCATLNQKIINVNIVAITRMLEKVLPSLVHKQHGLVISMSSILAKHVFPLEATYAATKAYVSHLTKCLAAEYESSGITFATFLPVIVSTPMTFNIGTSLLVPSSRAYVQSALKQIKYKHSFESNGYWVHTLMDRFYCALILAFSQEFLFQMINPFLLKVQKALLNMKRLKLKPKLDLAIIFNKNHEFWG